jgi:hypothetical protein
MTRLKWRWACLVGLLAAAMLSTGCDDMVRRSVRDGVFTFISGGLSQSLDTGGAFNSLLNDLLTGGLFGGKDNMSATGA